jgi:perosamine synthetase
MKIPWWSVKFSETQALAIAAAVRGRNISQGVITRELERILANRFNVEDCVCVSSGTSALIVSMIDAGVCPGSEVIVPNRTWIATAHAARILGATVKIAPVLSNIPVMDISEIERLISHRTKAIVPVFMNGRNVPGYEELKTICEQRNISLIDDAAQAIGSMDISGRQLGTRGNYGCFSLSIAKLIGSGQGGFILTNSRKKAASLRAIRTHGVESTLEPETWSGIGGNFRYTDLAASLVFEQLDDLERRVSRVRKLHDFYKSQIHDISGIEIIPINEDSGEVPVYAECLVEEREAFQNFMGVAGIETRKFYPDVALATYLGIDSQLEEKSIFHTKGIYLPSGPDLSHQDLTQVTNRIRAFFPLLRR